MTRVAYIVDVIVRIIVIDLTATFDGFVVEFVHSIIYSGLAEKGPAFLKKNPTKK